MDRSWRRGDVDDDIAPLLDELPDAVVVLDRDARVLWVNATAERMFGWPLAEIRGSSALAIVHPDDLALAAVCLDSVQQKDVGTPVEFRVRTATDWRLVEVIGAPDRRARGVVLSVRDLTERRRWEVAGSEDARFRSIVHNAAMLTLLLGADGVVQSTSGAITRMLGHDPEALDGKPFVMVVDRDDRTVFLDALRRAREGVATASAPVTAEVNLLRASGGGTVPFELSIVSLLDDPSVRGLAVSGHDISRLRQAQDALSELANFDPLTGLANRRLFDEALQREWTLTTRDGMDSFVVVADLDGFKAVNDVFGHVEGDRALKRFGRALRAVARETDVVARLGGDEFGVVLVRCGDVTAAAAFADRVREVMAALKWPGHLAVSIGFASLGASASAGEALHSADLAMFNDKRARRDTLAS